MIESIEFGSKRIDFKLEYADRKSLGITVTSDMDVLVRDPVDTPIESIREKIRKKAPWIIKQQSFFLSFHPKTPVRKYVGGETHLYLGRQYRLKINSVRTESVKLKAGYIEVDTQDKTRVKELVIDWYLHHARTKFKSIAQPLIERFKTLLAVSQPIALSSSIIQSSISSSNSSRFTSSSSSPPGSL